MNSYSELNKRRALGRGLESLIPSAPPAPSPPSNDEPSEIRPPELGKPIEISLEAIERNPFQTRTSFDEKHLDELAASIDATGVVQPILVRPLPDGRFQLIAGERRWLASQRAGKTTIPAMIRPVSDEQAMEMTIVENLQRADLNAIEQARAYERLSRDFKMTQEQMALRTGKDRSSIANFLRLLKLPVTVQKSIESGGLTFGHARALLALGSPDEIVRVAGRVDALALSVRQTEQYIQQIIHPERKPSRDEAKAAVAVDPNVREAQERLQRALGLKVHIEDKNGRGRVIIEYARLEDFDALMEGFLGGERGSGSN